jgi:uncharacterized protein YraI
MIWRRITWAAALLLAIFTTGVSAQASSGVASWVAEYYNNLYLSGTPVTDANVSAISFDWSSDAPVGGIPADNFSARFSSKMEFAAGTYRFFVRADDEVRLTIDSQIVIDTLDAARVGEVLSADVTLAAGTHQLRVDYRERTGDAYLFLTWENTASNPTSPNFPAMTTTTAAPVNLSPWLVQYFGNENLGGFPAGIFSEDEINHNWGGGTPIGSVPADSFSGRWTATPTLAAGDYRITARADDGVRVYVDSALVVDQWGSAVGTTVTHDMALTAGNHTFVVEYYERGGSAYIEVNVAKLSAVSSVVPTPVPAVKVPNSSTTTSATGTVNAYRLNVRVAPTTDAGIIVKVERGETYPVVGRSADSSWWQIDVNGTVGWVYGDFLVTSSTGSVPVTSSSGTTNANTLPSTGYTLTATSTVNLRSEPGRSGAVLGLLPRGAQADVLARNSTGTWIKVDYNGKVAWVSQAYVSLPVDANTLPVASK